MRQRYGGQITVIIGEGSEVTFSHEVAVLRRGTRRAVILLMSFRVISCDLSDNSSITAHPILAPARHQS